MRRLALVVVVVIGLGACAKAAPQGGTNSGIQGTVTVGPQCPVVQAESPCPDTPFDGKVQVSRGGGVIAQVQVDAQGSYWIALVPGTYVVLPMVAGNGGLPRATPQTVVVRDGAFTQADLTIDTGIR